MSGTNRKTIQFVHGSDDFSSIVSVGNEDTTIQASHIFRGLLQSSPEKEIVLTFPTAAQLIQSCPSVIPIAGYCKRFSLRNDGRAAITIAAGTGGSINGSDTIAVSNYAAHYVLRFTSVTSGVEAYQIIRE